MFAEMNLYSQRIICLYLDPRATLTVKMKDSEELGSVSMIAPLLSGFIIAPRDFSVDKELIVNVRLYYHPILLLLQKLC